MRCLLLLSIPLLAQPDAAHLKAFQKDVAPFLNRRCVACHNLNLKNADLNLARLKDPKEALAERNVWEDVLDKLRNGEMPPPGLPRPTAPELQALAKWVDAQISRHDANTPAEPGRVTARRLNKVEYNNTIRDLLHLDFQPADDFPNDDSGYGFDNIGDVLSLSPVLMEKYLSAAEKISRLAVITGKPGKPTLNRHPFNTAKAANHEFPAWAEYEIQIRIIDRRKEGDPLQVAFTIDNKAVKTAEFPAPPAAVNRVMKYTAPVTPGVHKLGVTFPGKLPGDYQVDYIEVRGPFAKEGLGLPETHRRIVICQERTAACAEKITANLLSKAWRRPVTAAEISRIASFTTQAIAAGQPLEQGVQFSLQAMLVSPNFLFRIEPPSPDAQPRKLTNPELAARLSYFLWSTMPDEALAAADLQQPSVLRAQVRRMLNDPKAAALVDNFGGQWLQLRNLEVHKPDPEKFPQFNDALSAAMGQETRRFFENILKEDRSILEFLDADYTFLNERLARHYGITGVTGDEFRKVQLPDSTRGGVLSHASVLTISSYPTRTSPVLRGKWIMENILGTPPPPPPPNVPELNTSEVGNTGTLRQQMEKHRANATCAVCHNKMDALGFGLENFDPVGQWRTHDGSFPIEPGGALPGNKIFKTPAELRAILKSDPKYFSRCLTEKLMTYALGRGLEKFDRPTISKICNKLAADGYRMSSLIDGIVESLPFQYRK
jgi:mono/diheme cytochrome c family protein